MLALALLPQFIGPDPAMAVRNYLISTNTTNPGFNVVYPTSTSGTNASCAICHATTGGGDDLNAYGEAWAVQHNSGLTTRAAFEAIQGANSDTDPTGATNITEINSNTQPGWTPGPHNTLYDVLNPGTDAVVATNQNPPTLNGSLDPAVSPPPNQPPVLTNPGNKTVNENTLLTFTISATDDGPATALKFTAGSLPTGAKLTDNLNGTATFAWTPTFAQGQTTPYPVTITVTDGGGLSASQSFNITVGNVNRPPVLTPNPVGNQTVAEGQSLTIAFNGSDPDGDLLTFSSSVLPTGASLTSGTNGAATFAWTPATGQAGNYSVTVTVTDPGALTASQTFTITVGNVNQPPVLTNPGNKTVNENTLLTFTISATDDGPATALKFTAGSLPTGAKLTDNLNGTATFAWTPTFAQGQTTPYPVTITVTDGGGLSASQSFNITVGNVNRPPVLTPNPVGNQTVAEGQSLTIAFNGSDPDGDLLTFSSSVLPTGASLAAGSTNIATFSWTPAPGQASSTPYPVTITVTDPGKLAASQSFNITVQAPTPTPVCTMTVSPTSLAFGSVNVGSNKTMTTAIGNSGTANCTVSSLTVSGAGFALGSGAPSLPTTVAPGAAVNVPVNFAPTTGAAASGSLTIGSAVVSLSGTGATVTAPPPTTGAVDYNVQAFKATEEVELSKKKPVRLRLTVKNVGKVPGNAPATLVGMQKGSEVYRETMAVSAPVGKTGTFDFPSYTPTAAGKIKWTVTIQDQGPEHNTATATTEVKGEDKQETEHSDRKGS